MNKPKAGSVRGIMRVIWIFLIFLLAACGQATSTVQATQVVAAVQAPPTIPGVALPKGMLTTSLPEPTATEVFVATPISTMRPTRSPERIMLSRSYSPDRRWEASLERNFSEGEERIIFRVSLDYGNMEWIVEDKLYVDLEPFGYPFPEPYYWTKDGRYLYYTHIGRGDGCFGGGRHRGFDFYRLDLFSGEAQQIADGGTWISMSPDENHLATFNYAAEGPSLWNLETGVVETLELLVSQEVAGMELDQQYIVWAPDSRSLIYVIAAGVCDEERGHFNWIVRVDIDTLSQEIILARDERALIPVAWIEADKVVVSDGTQMLWMDPFTGEVVTAR